MTFETIARTSRASLERTQLQACMDAFAFFRFATSLQTNHAIRLRKQGSFKWKWNVSAVAEKVDKVAYKGHFSWPNHEFSCENTNGLRLLSSRGRTAKLTDETIISCPVRYAYLTTLRPLS